MVNRKEKLDKLVELLDQHIPQEGVIHKSGINCFVSYKSSTTSVRVPVVYEATVVIGVQGKKNIYVGNKKYEYGDGKNLALFLPMLVESELVEASPEKPCICAGIRIDTGRMADLLLKIERIEGVVVKPSVANPSGIFIFPLSDALLDLVIRLVETLSNPMDTAILGEMIVDEIYYYLLCSEYGHNLRSFLQQRGQIQQISRAVEHIHQNLNKPVSVEILAELVNMSRTSFHEKFKEVMHLPPLQYAKSIKLEKARLFIQNGKSVSEAGYLVGYNSPAQFSREYKRHFGISPSEEKEQLSMR